MILHRPTKTFIVRRCCKLVCVLCRVGRPYDPARGYHVSKPGAGGILLPDGACHAKAIRDVYLKGVTK